MNCRSSWCAIPLILVLAPQSAWAGEEQKPTAAFIDVGRSRVGPLLEQMLIRREGVAWLERNEIDELLRERKLSSLFAPEAGPQRTTVGKMLNADLLVLLRHFEKPKAHVQLVVCETRRGLRLAVDRVVLSPEVEADVQQLSALVERAIARHGRKIREICAVPPFVSNDLTYENEHLKAAYAKLVEQTARDRPGLLCVEFEEARAIAREVAIATEGIRRPMPLYLLGEFRHEGKNGKQTATVRIRVMRGDRELAERETTGLSPDAATRFVQEASRALIQRTLGIRPLPPNPKLEAQQLARRADTFHLLGAWEEAATLAEASLLLDPRQMRMHQVAASSLASLARPTARWEYKKDPETVVRGIRLYLRALEHYEAYLPSVSHFSKRGNRLLDGRVRMAVFWPQAVDPPAIPNIGPAAAKLRGRELEIYRRIIHSRCKMKTGDEYWFVWAALRYRPTQEKFDILREIVLSIQDLPDAQRLARQFSLLFDNGAIPNISTLESPEGRRYLQSLAEVDNQQIQQAVAQLRDLLEQDSQEKKPFHATPTPPRPAGPKLVRFVPLEIAFPSASSRPLLAGWIPAGPQTDLVWNSRAEICLMKEPGRLTRIHSAKGLVNTAGYDGRFAWVTVWRPGRKPALLVVDPKQERLWEISENDGLPVVPHETLPNPRNSQRLWVEPLEPGRALLVSHFGRMAIGNATFDPDKGAKIQVFFEGRLQPDRTDPEPWRNPQMAFRPEYVVRFQQTADDAGPQCRVLVGGRSRYDEDWPLLVDPDKGSARVLETSIRHGIDLKRVARTQDAVFRSKYNRLYRIGLPDFRPQILLRDVPEGYCVKQGEKFLVFGLKCWQVDPAAQPGEHVRVLADRVPWPFRDTSPLGFKLAREENLPPEDVKSYRLEFIARSNHYGLLAVRRKFEQIAEGHSRSVGDEVLRIIWGDANEADSK